MQRTYQINEFNVTRTAKRRQHIGMRIMQIAVMILIAYAVTR